MKVKDIMCKQPYACHPGDSLDVPCHIMWEHDCGFVPVTDPFTGRACGIITDRDVSMSSFLQGQGLQDVTVGEAMVVPVHACEPDDELATVHATMRKHQVRRLPVLDDDQQPVGVVTLNDLSLAASKDREKLEVANTLAVVGAHRSLSVVETAGT